MTTRASSRVLAKTARQVEAAAQRGKVRPSGRTAYQVVALLVREERARVKADTTVPESERAAVLSRLDGIATILAKTAARDTSLLELLAEGAFVSPSAVDLKNDLLRAGRARARAGAGARGPRPGGAADPSRGAARRSSPASWRTPSWHPTSRRCRPPARPPTGSAAGSC